MFEICAAPQSQRAMVVMVVVVVVVVMVACGVNSFAADKCNYF